MNPKISLVALGLLVLAALSTSQSARPVSAQSGGGYDLTWNTIDGGGGTSTGGAYSLSGTIGQFDAGMMSGGSYTLIGGFWVDWLGNHLNLPLIIK
jgi:hypothetical protein